MEGNIYQVVQAYQVVYRLQLADPRGNSLWAIISGFDAALVTFHHYQLALDRFPACPPSGPSSKEMAPLITDGSGGMGGSERECESVNVGVQTGPA